MAALRPTGMQNIYVQDHFRREFYIHGLTEIFVSRNPSAGEHVVSPPSVRYRIITTAEHLSLPSLSYRSMTMVRYARRFRHECTKQGNTLEFVASRRKWTCNIDAFSLS